MQINIEKIAQLVLDADKIFMKPEAEENLVQLLEIQTQVEAAIVEVKAKLEATALQIDPNFRSIQSDLIKVHYRSFGQRYYVDELQKNLAPKELYTEETKVVYKVDAKAVEKWIKENNGMPAGISEVERQKKLTISLKSEATNDDQ